MRDLVALVLCAVFLAGGHIMDFILENATVEMDFTPQFIIVLPIGGNFAGVDPSGDLSRELATVEQGST